MFVKSTKDNSLNGFRDISVPKNPTDANTPGICVGCVFPETGTAIT